MSEGAAPNVIVLAGPNGAGKSTIAQSLLLEELGIVHFVNADTLARGLSAFHPEEVAIKAGKVMLEHLHDLAGQRLDFAFETTLASRTFAPWIARLRGGGYVFRLYYVWLPSADVAIERVRERVRHGGHDVPSETIRRRYQRSLHNFFHLYRPLADSWQVYDNSVPGNPALIAEGVGTMERVQQPVIWQVLRQGAGL